LSVENFRFVKRVARSHLSRYNAKKAHQMPCTDTRFRISLEYGAGAARTILRIASFIGLLIISFEMLSSGLWFEPAYNAGIPPWLHTTAGFIALGTGLIGLIRMMTRRTWHRGSPAVRTSTAVKVLGAVAVLAFSVSRLWERFRPLPPVPGASREAVAFFDGALRHMERFYLRKADIDWPSFRRQAYRRIEGARTARETFGALRATIVSLGKDAHNQLVAENWKEELGSRAPPSSRRPMFRLPALNAHLTKDGIAYISVPWFDSDGLGALYRLHDPEGRAYARRLREKLRALDAMSPRGWIVDLRGNQGGNMWPMLDGLAPLIGEGRVAALDMPQFGRRVDTWIVAGNSYSGTPWFAGLGSRPPPLKNGAAPVAILTGPATASAGEGVLVAFKGRPRTRQFGRATFGVPTSPASHALGDGAVLFVTIARQMDRLGRSYDGAIPPDEEIKEPGRGDASPIIAAATRWIKSEAAAGSPANK
jgi:hypothetical protein